jgi:hypothetical protein
MSNMVRAITCAADPEREADGWKDNDNQAPSLIERIRAEEADDALATHMRLLRELASEARALAVVDSSTVEGKPK